MVDMSDEADLKIVDVGLSKIIGPNETSLDPFGTLVRHTFSLTNLTPSFLYIVLCSPRGTFAKALWKGGRPLELGCNHLLAAQQSASIR